MLRFTKRCRVEDKMHLFIHYTNAAAHVFGLLLTATCRVQRDERINPLLVLVSSGDLFNNKMRKHQHYPIKLGHEIFLQ